MNTALIVDDSLMDRQVISTYLHEAGLKVLSAESGEEAMSKLVNSSPDLIVLDIVMEGKSGFEICRKLKTDDNTKSIPVIICSFKSTEADKMWGKVVGADAYLAKPVERDEFISTVKQLISKW